MTKITASPYLYLALGFIAGALLAISIALDGIADSLKVLAGR